MKTIKSYCKLRKILKAVGEKHVFQKLLQMIKEKRVYTRIASGAGDNLKKILADTIFEYEVGFQRLTNDPGIDIVIKRRA